MSLDITVYYNDSGHISLWPPYQGVGFNVDSIILGNSMGWLTRT
jgi:hypothetical protein